ncbi:FtsX-like permease family protein [Algoriphagus sp.]|uniref:FtsX-like permease family protein n=1 Tax=Algoriphagus sp. TaxID=1872435 RepID=UPI003918AEBB
MGSVLVFLAIAILILGIAYVNYLNLSSAAILTRIKEVKMRKVLGAQSWQLAQQFMTETLVLLSGAAFISGLLIYLFSPVLSRIFGQPIWIESLILPEVILLVCGIMLTCAFISGTYVVVLSGSFDKKSKLKFKPDSQVLRKSLVVFQFVISVGIIICTLVIKDQLSFMQNQNLGMNVNQKVAIAGPNDAGENRRSKMNAFKESLRSQSFVQELAGSNNIPGIGYNFSAGGITPLVPRPEDENYNYSMLIIDEQFFPVYDIELIAGRNFNMEETIASWNVINKVILNEKAARQLGFENPESAAVLSILWGKPFEIVGVVKDYHHMSLREEIKPMIFLASQADGFFILTMESSNMKANLASIQVI